jgi:hypothetical protein
VPEANRVGNIRSTSVSRSWEVFLPTIAFSIALAVP